MIDFDTLLQVLDSSVRLSIPLLLACLAGLFSERAGIFDIGLEGKMLASAFSAGAIAAFILYAKYPEDGEASFITHLLIFLKPVAVLVGALAGVVTSIALSAVHGVASITFKGNQLISGVAINFLASGLTALVGQNWFRQGGQTPPLNGSARFNEITLPFAELLKDVPVFGKIYYELISGHTLLVYIAFLIVPLTWWILFRTRFGLRLRAVGENPAAVDTSGISVVRQRYAAIIICGILCGLAGAYLSTGIGAGFGKEMTAGKGFIALAALIFAKWKPVPALWACLLFGFLEAIGIRFQSIEIPGAGTIPLQLMQALPYILTVIILAGFVGKAIPPKAGGEPYNKE